MDEQQQVAVKLTSSPVAVLSRAELLLCSKDLQKRFAEYEKLGLLEIIDKEAGRPVQIGTSQSGGH